MKVGNCVVRKSPGVSATSYPVFRHDKVTAWTIYRRADGFEVRGDGITRAVGAKRASLFEALASVSRILD